MPKAQIKAAHPAEFAVSDNDVHVSKFSLIALRSGAEFMTTPSKCITDAVNDAPELKLLSQRIALGKRRLACIAQVLPASLASHLDSGGCDEQSWCVLVPNNAVAAKLRQMLPLLQQALEREEGTPIEVRLRIANAR